MTVMILGALAIGLTLGLLGSGGSILTVPVLVYVMGHGDKTAIAESLAIVGLIALVGMLPYVRSKEIDWRSVFLFGLPGMAGTYAGGWLARFVPGGVQLVLFALVMLLAAGIMLRRSRAQPAITAAAGPAGQAVWKIVLEGLAVGILTGLVGVGGGFLIVPALVVLGKLPMRLAVGTSLVVIALKSLSGFASYHSVLESMGSSVDWQTIGVFAFVGILGSFAGNMISARLNPLLLQRGFAAFLVLMGIFVIVREAPHVFGNAVAQGAPEAGIRATSSGELRS
jgi:uncharacterized protein